MLEKLAFVTIVITQGVEGLPEGTVFTTNDPVRCSVSMDQFIAEVEKLGAKANGFCDYTFAPARSIRPRARGDQ